MAQNKITKEEKLAQIAEARKLYAEAQVLINKANRLIEKGVRGVVVCGGDSYEEQKYPAQYKGMIEIHLFKGILKLEKLLGIKATPRVNACGDIHKDEKALCVEGIEFFQLGQATQSKFNYK